MSEEIAEPVMKRSDRDPAETGRRFGQWLTEKLGPGADPVIDSLVSPEKNGMSSETLLIDATWTEDGERGQHQLVARLEPPSTAVPVFPDYFLDHQYETMRLVGSLCSAPVPRTYWLETDPEPVGAPFFVMERLDGVVPPDVMPYDMGSWVTEATDEQRDQLSNTTVEVLAAIHGIADSPTVFAFLDGSRPEGTSPLRAHFEAQRAYYQWTTQGASIPVIDECFAHLEATWPAVEPESVLCWGDSRIGNVMYRDFEPIAVFDWEMAAIAPREMDLAWMIFLHRFFEDICIDFGLPGLPTMLRRGDVERKYAEVSGYTPTEMDWFLTYAAMRHGIVMNRVKQRGIHFGEDVQPETADGMVLHAPTIRRMIEGTYWSTLPAEAQG